MTAPGPNPWKVVVILEELGVPYEINSFAFREVKTKPFIDINPNGRVPGKHILLGHPRLSAVRGTLKFMEHEKQRLTCTLAIEDPNTGITLWESGAIILYLIE
jgi:glutathione S-transferase